ERPGRVDRTQIADPPCPKLPLPAPYAEPDKSLVYRRLRGSRHRYSNAARGCRGYRLGVPRIRVPRDPYARVAGQHAFKPGVGLHGAVRDDHHPRMERVPDAYAAALMDGYPCGARRRV